jgi:hypothetical protein
MSLLIFLEAVAAWAVVIFLISAFITYLVQTISISLEVKGKTLERFMRRIFGDQGINLFYRYPQIRVLRPYRFKDFSSFFTATVEPKMVEDIPLPLLVDTFMEMFMPDQKLDFIKNTPECEGKAVLLSWIESGHTDAKVIREKATDYLTGILKQVSSINAAITRSFMVLLASAFTVLMGLDSIELLKNLMEASVELKTIAIVGANPEAILGILNPGLGWQKLAVQPQGFSEWVYYITLKISGLGITAVLAALGIDFWIEALKKVGVFK